MIEVDPTDLSPIWLSLKVATVATISVAPVGTAIAWGMSQTPRFRGKALVETALTLPLVMPPTVIGFGLLLLLGRGTPIGRWINDVAGIRLLFTWQGAVVAAAVMSLPLFYRSAEAGFKTIDRELMEAGRTLGASELQLLFAVVVPLAYRSLIAGTALAFARSLGEFGATIVVAGSLMGTTRTMPIALYQAVEAGRDRDAIALTALLTVTTFIFLAIVGSVQSQIEKNIPGK